MTDRIFLSESNTTILACSVCNRQKVFDMTPYLSNPHKQKLKVKCKCGNSWTVNLEKRHYARKSTNLPGDFVVFRDGKPVDSGHMMVVDLSLRGIKIRLNRQKNLEVGDRLEVDFTLDNKAKTNIKRRVQVKNIEFPFVGASFSRSDRHDPDIGFYLQGKRG